MVVDHAKIFISYEMTMQNIDRDMTRKECDRNGLPWAKARLIQLNGHGLEQYVAEWINEKEAESEALLEARRMSLNTRSVEAAETSAMAALESSKASNASARAAIFAALVSFFALVVAIAAYLKS